MKKKVGIGILVVLLVGAILGGFYYATHRPSAGVENSTEITEIQELITMDLDANYPASPRAVVNLYSRMLACMYNEEYTDEELERLLEQMYQLFDEELQENNPEDTYYESMKADAQSYKEKNWRISNYNIPDTDEVTYDTIDGYDFSVLTVSYFIKEDDSYVRTFQDYMLRKDSEGKWKIYGYKLSDTSDESGEAGE